MDVKEIMVKDVISIHADATVKEAVELMNKNEIGCLIVARKREAVGIVTERDVLTRVVSKSRDPEVTKVSEIMSKPLIVGGPDMYVEDAARLMFKRNIKKLPVMKKWKTHWPSELVGYCPGCKHRTTNSEGNRRTEQSWVASS